MRLSISSIPRSINLSPGDDGSHGIVVNGNGPVLINSITNGSSAEMAGLKMYDLIIKVINTVHLPLVKSNTQISFLVPNVGVSYCHR